MLGSNFKVWLEQKTAKGAAGVMQRFSIPAKDLDPSSTAFRRHLKGILCSKRCRYSCMHNVIRAAGCIMFCVYPCSVHGCMIIVSEHNG